MTTDPLIQPFFTALLDYREAVRQRVEMLTDEELTQVYDLLRPDNLRNIPPDFWTASFTIRARIRIEQKRRQKIAALTLSGATN